VDRHTDAQGKANSFSPQDLEVTTVLAHLHARFKVGQWSIDVSDRLICRLIRFDIEMAIKLVTKCRSHKVPALLCEAQRIAKEFGGILS